jgi:membrane-associated protease RseP (regulator of RpoE activity)
MFRVALILVIIVFFALDVFMFYRHFSMAATVPDTAEDTLDEDKPALQEKPVPRVKKVTTYHSRPEPAISATEKTKIPLMSTNTLPSIRAENFSIPPDAKIIRYRADYWKVRKQILDKVDIDQRRYPDQIFTEENGEPVILVNRVRSNSLIEKIGIRKGDKIRAVNGFKIRNNEEDAFELYEKLKNENIIIVEIERDNSIMYLWYKITR